MADLPNPFSDPGVNPFSPGDAAVCLTPDVPPVCTAAEYDSLMDCIGEIFAGARKLFDPDPAAYTNQDEVYYDLLRQMDDPHTADLIAIPAGMWLEFDPPPLFLREAS